MEWLFDQTTKLWKLEATGRIQLQWLKKMSTWPQLLEESKISLDCGVRALTKVLAYMGEVVVLSDRTCGRMAWPPRAFALRDKVAKYTSDCCCNAPAMQ